MGNTQAKSTDNEINQIINLLGHEEKYLQTITGLLTFGVFKYIVFPFLKDIQCKSSSIIRLSFSSNIFLKLIFSF
jgi:hypothetical protein